MTASTVGITSMATTHPMWPISTLPNTLSQIGSFSSSSKTVGTKPRATGLRKDGAGSSTRKLNILFFGYALKTDLICSEPCSRKSACHGRGLRKRTTWKPKPFAIGKVRRLESPCAFRPKRSGIVFLTTRKRQTLSVGRKLRVI